MGGRARKIGGSRCRQREKEAVWKAVRALARMLVIVSALARLGLNWYLEERAR